MKTKCGIPYLVAILFLIVHIGCNKEYINDNAILKDNSSGIDLKMPKVTVVPRTRGQILAVKISFVDRNDSVVKEIDLHSMPSYSPNMRNMILAEKKEPRSPYIYDIYDFEGNLVKKVTKDYGTSTYMLSDDMHTAYLWRNIHTFDDGKIKFYDTEDKLISTVDLGNTGYVYGMFLDDHRAVLLTEIHGIRKNWYNYFHVNWDHYYYVDLRCYDITGKLIWKYEFKDLNSTDTDINGNCHNDEGTTPISVDKNNKRIYVVGMSDKGMTDSELWKYYKLSYHPGGATKWVFDFDGKFIKKIKIKK